MKAEGARYGALMTECNVLRCTATVATAFTIPSDAFPREFGVCQEHADALNGGAEYRLDLDEPQRPTILMGDDLRGLHEWVVKNYGVRYLTDVPNARIELEVERLGTTEREKIEVWITPEGRRGLSQMLVPPWDKDDLSEV